LPTVSATYSINHIGEPKVDIKTKWYRCLLIITPTTMSSTYDYIIVGGGTAGVTIASRLKQYLPDSRIALLETGPDAVDHPKVNAVSDGSEWLQLMGEGLVVDYSTTPQP
jgi:choline dehydrogenase-like flavoprotein